MIEYSRMALLLRARDAERTAREWRRRYEIAAAERRELERRINKLRPELPAPQKI